MSAVISFCASCKNHIGLSADYSKAFCKAFPDGDGIPFDYAFGSKGIDVRKLKECANGFKFEKI